MSKTYLRFHGVRGSHAAPFPGYIGVGGNTSCVEINHNGRLLVCDAGTGIIPFGRALQQQKEPREIMIILTHYHWDHVCGLPFFAPAFSSDWKIYFFGPGDSPAMVEKLISAQMQAPYFPVGIESWLAQVQFIEPKNCAFTYGDIDISFSGVVHPGMTYGYRIEVNGKVVVYLSDHECMFLSKQVKRQSDTLSEEEQAWYKEAADEEYKSELKLIQDADILIHDAQYTPDDYEKKYGWGHSCYIDAVNAAIDANVKMLYLFHHDPEYDDEKIDSIYQHSIEIVNQRKSSMICRVAKEGEVFDL